MTANAPDDDTKAGDTPPPRVVVLCHAAPFRKGLAHAFGPASADIDPAALADRLAAERGWSIARTNIYHSSDEQLDETHRTWVERLKDTHSTLVTQPGDIRVRMALDGMRALRERQADILLVMGGDTSFMALAQDTRTAAREQKRPIKFASAFAPSSHPLGQTVPSADHSITIDRGMAEKCLVSGSTAAPSRRIYAGRSMDTASAPSATPQAQAPQRTRRRLMPVMYSTGVIASMMALMWEDVVASGGTDALDWPAERWGVSTLLALGKSVVWPLYWLARAFGIDAGGA
ncbi:NYN domain-containing protein [Pyruvatibacter sp.]